MFRSSFPQSFEEQYHCLSFAMSGKQLIEESDKILLPASALETLARLNVEYPMLFEISADNAVGGMKTHCGVLEFSAEEGRCYLPYWMMQNLNVEEDTILNVKNVSLPKATYTKIRAQSVEFLEIQNHRAVLEVTLRNFSCLTKGEIITIKHADKLHHLEVCDVQPGGAASIIETDMQVSVVLYIVYCILLYLYCIVFCTLYFILYVVCCILLYIVYYCIICCICVYIITVTHHCYYHHYY